ncbi:hypothetical protein GCWU000324_02434 [Kingella oralis ATCC 51147]|uniref:Uncharacterized protein n=1 Tax=Kingella oralis ATCC 51147 TaxID=629741 RepID=C4GK60_9NEIS|nr:hypothetical protein GCWU000324_02434 [Kingella oralis ATCC 51147]
MWGEKMCLLLGAAKFVFQQFSRHFALKGSLKRCFPFSGCLYGVG